MHSTSRTEARLAAALERIAGAVYPERVPLECAMAKAQSRLAMQRPDPSMAMPRCEPGCAWGVPGETVWFRFRARIPSRWQGRCVVALVRLAPPQSMEGFTAEGLIYRGGRPAGAINVHRGEVPLVARARGGEAVEFWVEAAANVCTIQPARHTPDSPAFCLEQAELAFLDRQASAFYHDYRVALEAMQALEGAPRRQAELREALHAALNAWEHGEGPGVARRRLASAMAAPNGPRAFVVSAIGHAHLDTAWLWPVRETIRKCARTFSEALRLMRQYPHFIFLASQAQHYAWMKAFYPEIWEGIRKAIRRGQWEPAGSLWVEPDANMLSGESFLRQILHGKKFFQEEFGLETRDLWMPDTFGFSAALPQIAAHAGVEFLFTQKLSWSQFNRFPHHTFWWEGLDGSRLFAHFPPSDTYNAELGPAALRKTELFFREHGRSQRALLVYGYGDGGGGPSAAMLEAAERLQDFEGLPRLKLQKASEFFQEARQEAAALPVWRGELYLELHRGAFTSQAAIKRAHRESEALLHDAEFLDAVDAMLRPRRREALKLPPRAPHDTGALGHPRPGSHAATLERAWKLLLLNQFHDILPGSCVREACEDARRDFETIRALGMAVREAALEGLAKSVAAEGFRAPVLLVNTLGFRRREVAALPDGSPAWVDVPPYGYAVIEGAGPHQPPEKPARAWSTRAGTVLENGLVRVRLNARGQIASLTDLQARREVLEPGRPANLLLLFEDRPAQWDAWDIEIYYREVSQVLEALEPPEIVEAGPWRARVRWCARFSSSFLEQEIILRAGSPRLDFATQVAWRESHKLLRAEFPVAVRPLRARFETAFGHVERPTHRNTSWDMARFEVPAHRWMDLSETGYGVALLNNGKYGCSIHGATLGLSLLRAPKEPDPTADLGQHAFIYSLLPHAGDLGEGRVIEEAAALHHPFIARELQPSSGSLPPSHSFFVSENPAAILDTIKRAEDGQGLVLRIYEAQGSRARTRIHVRLPISRAELCDGLERPLRPIPIQKGTIPLDLSPFQIASIKLAP